MPGVHFISGDTSFFKGLVVPLGGNKCLLGLLEFVCCKIYIYIFFSPLTEAAKESAGKSVRFDKLEEDADDAYDFSTDFN